MKPYLKLTTLKLTTVLCGLAFAVPQLALASDTEKAVEVCNNFADKPIWVVFGSTVLPDSENRWQKLKIEKQTCQTQAIPIKHFDAGRAYIFDREPQENEYNSNGNFQLVEFTFRWPGGKGGTAGDGVGYNFSGVDSVSGAIPLAVEATFIDPQKAATDSFSYTGNLMKSDAMSAADQKQLDAEFEKLVSAGWPYYPNASHDGHYKIPGGYNALSHDKQNGMWAYKAGVTPLTPEALTKRWKNWVDGTINCSVGVPQSPNANDPKYTQQFCTEFQNEVKAVWNAFLENRNKHNPTAANLLSETALVQHIVGYALFNEEDHSLDFSDLDQKKVGPKWTAIAQGIPAVLPKYEKYRFPDYNSPYNLDPYVTAMHKNFGLNVYAFSINDEIGYFDAPKQDKLVIAVGGLKGLPNKEQAVAMPNSDYRINLGPGWEQIEQICEAPKVFKLKASEGSSTPLLFTDEAKSCDIRFVTGTLAAPKAQVKVKATLNNGVMKIDNCSDSKNGQLCANVQAVKTIKNLYDINGPVPN